MRDQIAEEIIPLIIGTTQPRKKFSICFAIEVTTSFQTTIPWGYGYVSSTN